MRKKIGSLIFIFLFLSVLFCGSSICLTAYAEGSNNQQIEIINQTENSTVVLGKSLKISLEVNGNDLSCQWYYKKSGETAWSKWAGRTNPCETVTPNASWNGIQLYCLITDGSGASVSSDTITITVIKPLKVLGSGDSICAGLRNGGKGFVGDLGLPYKNIGVSGATLSTKYTAVKNIPDRFLEFYRYHSQSVNPQNDGWEPDIIIAEGGINDYTRSAPLGAIPVVPVKDETALELLDQATLMGGLQRLLYYMNTFYPKSEKYFLITHKTYSASLNNTLNTFNYLPETENAEGYTQQDMHDALLSCCKTYDISVIDVYNESFLDSSIPEYRSETRYADDPSVTYREYIDYDGVHPLSLGYIEGYVPVIKKHINLYQPVEPSTLKITQQPESKTVELGNPMTLSVKADGTDLKYQWYYKKVGQDSFSPYRTGASETVTPNASWDGIQLYCVVKDSGGNSLQSDTVTVHVTQTLAITQQPESKTVTLGDSITLSLKAQGIGLSYQWYFKKVGQDSFSEWNNRKRASETVTPPESWNGIQLYCIVKDGSGNSLQSDTVTVHVTQTLAITQQPESKTVTLGDSVTLSVKAQGIGLSYQWYFKKVGQDSFSKWNNRKRASETVTPNASWDGIQLYCVVKDSGGNSLQSDTVTVHVTQELAITQQPESKTVTLGDSVTLSLKAQGIGLSYQWYYKKVGQDSFSEWNSRKRAGETVTPPESWDGIQLYCVLKDSGGNSLQSDTVTVAVIKDIA